MSFDEDFISRVVTAFDKTMKETKKFPDREGMERQFRHFLAPFLFGEVLGWKEHYQVAEILDITCYDDENFPIIVVETKWRVELTSEMKEKLRRHIEELGSAKYGVLTNERDFIAYEYADYKLKEITKINVAEAIGVARGKFPFSNVGKKRILKLELLKRERLVGVEEPDYFEKTHKQISVARAKGVELLTKNLKVIIRDLTAVFVQFFRSYQKRGYHYSGRYLSKTFSDWLTLSMRDEDFSKGDETEKERIIDVFCRETAYVLLGRILFIRICEDKGILQSSLSGKKLAESVRFYGKRENLYLRIFYDSLRKSRSTTATSTSLDFSTGGSLKKSREAH